MQGKGIAKSVVMAEAGEYLKSIKEIPVLSKEEEQELFASLACASAKSTRASIVARLVSGSLHLVVRVAGCFTNSQADFLDFIQEGNLRLLALAEKFDKGFGVRFSTYAVPGLYFAMLRLDRANRRSPVCRERAISLMRCQDGNQPEILALAREVVTIGRARVKYVVELLELIPPTLIRDSHRDIFKRYYGLTGKPRESLNQLGIAYGVTRKATSYACKRIWKFLKRRDPALNAPNFEATLERMSEVEELLHGAPQWTTTLQVVVLFYKNRNL